MALNQLFAFVCLSALLHAQPFLYSQSLSIHSSYSETSDISGDNQVLVIGNSNTNATYIFRNNASFFMPTTRIPAFAPEVKLVDITDDGKWILVVELSGLIRLVNYTREINVVVL